MADNNGVSLQLKGTESLKEAMRAVGPAIAKRAYKTGMRKGAQRLARAMKQAAPKQTGTLRKSIKYKSLKRRRDRAVGFKVGLWTNYYYKTLEYPSARGPAMHPFMETAWKQTQGEVLKAVINGFDVAVDVEAGKAYAKQKRNKR